mgnify:CR=1 FL=1
MKTACKSVTTAAWKQIEEPPIKLFNFGRDDCQMALSNPYRHYLLSVIERRHGYTGYYETR